MNHFIKNSLKVFLVLFFLLIFANCRVFSESSFEDELIAMEQRLLELEAQLSGETVEIEPQNLKEEKALFKVKELTVTPQKDQESSILSEYKTPVTQKSQEDVSSVSTRDKKGESKIGHIPHVAEIYQLKIPDQAKTKEKKEYEISPQSLVSPESEKPITTKSEEDAKELDFRPEESKLDQTDNKNSLWIALSLIFFVILVISFCIRTALKSVKLGVRISMGFAAIIVFLVVLWLVSFLGLVTTINDSQSAISASQMQIVLTEKEVDHLNWMRAFTIYLSDYSADQLFVPVDKRKCELGLWLGGNEAKKIKHKNQKLGIILSSIEASHSRLHEFALRVHNTHDLGANGEFDPALVKENIKKMFFEHMLVSSKEIQDQLQNVRQEISATFLAQEVVLARAKGLKLKITILGILAIITAVFLSLILARRITGILRKIVMVLSSSSFKSANAIAGVLSVAKQITQSLSEQSAVLRESSHSLVKMNSLADENAKKSQEANKLALKAKVSAKSGNIALVEAQKAIEAINKSYKEVSKIVKVVEDMAFQTNLIAYNAVVEASNAGENRGGFADLAIEVKKLAKQAAEVAKEAASIVEENINKINASSKAVSNSGQMLEEIDNSFEKLADLVTEISDLSRNQAENSNRVKEVVNKLEHITKQNALAAQEGACSAKELDSQAQALKEIASELKGMTESTSSAVINLTKKDIFNKNKKDKHFNIVYFDSRKVYDKKGSTELKGTASNDLNKDSKDK